MSGDATRTRFLGAIGAQLPIDRVVEVHLFGPIRQGGMESGVAVIAVDPNEVVPDDASDELAVVAEIELPEDDVDVDADAHVDTPTPVMESVDDVLEEPVVRADGEVVEPEPGVAGSPYAQDQAAAVEEEPAEPRRPAPRYTVYTARYRHTLKGPDRGKWEASVTEEADAPLITVDAVVRGVSRRSGEADETVRLSGEEFRAALPAAPIPAPGARPFPARA
jgi:hypothetical protein